jgi:hypothetical protein
MMQTDEKLKKRIAYEKMLAGISERAVSVNFSITRVLFLGGAAFFQ